MTEQSKIPVPPQDEPAEAKGSLIERVVRNYDLVKLAPAPIPEELIPPAAKRRRYRRADEVAEVEEVAPAAAPSPAPAAEARPEVVEAEVIAPPPTVPATELVPVVQPVQFKGPVNPVNRQH